jgi:hypothetical protein
MPKPPAKPKLTGIGDDSAVTFRVSWELKQRTGTVINALFYFPPIALLPIIVL